MKYWCFVLVAIPAILYFIGGGKLIYNAIESVSVFFRIAYNTLHFAGVTAILGLAIYGALRLLREVREESKGKK